MKSYAICPSRTRDRNMVTWPRRLLWRITFEKREGVWGRVMAFGDVWWRLGAYLKRMHSGWGVCFTCYACKAYWNINACLKLQIFRLYLRMKTYGDVLLRMWRIVYASTSINFLSYIRIYNTPIRFYTFAIRLSYVFIRAIRFSNATYAH